MAKQPPQPAEASEGAWLRLIRLFGFGDRIDKRYAATNRERGFSTVATPASQVALDTFNAKRRRGTVVDVTQGRVSGVTPTVKINSHLQAL